MSCLERSGASHAAQQSPPSLAALCACDNGDSAFPDDPPSFASLAVNWLRLTDSWSVARSGAFEYDCSWWQARQISEYPLSGCEQTLVEDTRTTAYMAVSPLLLLNVDPQFVFCSLNAKTSSNSM